MAGAEREREREQDEPGHGRLLGVNICKNQNTRGYLLPCSVHVFGQVLSAHSRSCLGSVSGHLGSEFLGTTLHDASHHRRKIPWQGWIQRDEPNAPSRLSLDSKLVDVRNGAFQRDCFPLNPGRLCVIFQLLAKTYLSILREVKFSRALPREADFVFFAARSYCWKRIK